MRTILLVDDEESIRRIYRDVLEQKGYRVLTAAGVSEAEALLKNNGINLLLLDIKMADGGGNALYKALERMRKDIRVIVSSVYPVEHQRRVIRDAFDYFDKSQGLQNLIEKIDNVLIYEQKVREQKLKKRNIFILDEDLERRLSYHDLLSGAGYTPIETGYSLKIFDFLRKQGQHIQVILLSLMVPEVLGVNFYELLRSRFPRIKIIVASELTIAQQQSRIKDADDYFQTSDSPHVLLEKVQRFVS